MSNIDKQALRGQSVEGSYYLAECGYCGQVMPSSKLRVLHSPDGEVDCYCPHCNAEDCEIFDLGTAGSEVVNAWNYQQKRVEALLDELEAKDKSISFLKDQLAQLANFNPDWDKLEAATDSLREHMAELTAARKRIAELEEKLARPVSLPKTNGYWNEQEKAYEEAITLAKRQIRLAGFRCEGDE